MSKKIKMGKVSMMRLLNNKSLIEAYYRAVDLDLDREFISLLLAEIRRRNLDVNVGVGA